MKRPLLLATLLFLGLNLRARADAVVVFNEIMYHPATTETNLEWLELRNQLAVDVDISGWSLAGGVQYTFPSNSIVRGGRFVVVAISPATLGALTGLTNIYGPFTGRLGNNGDHLELRNNSGRVMDQVDYGVDGDWPAAPDGSGVSLAKLDRDAASGPPENWTWSGQMGGTPGADNFPSTGGTAFETRLIAVDASWKFEDSGTDLGTAWRNPTFNDSGWGARASFTNRPVSTLFNTGVDANHVALAPGAVDAHYKLTAAAQGTVGANAIVEQNHAAWLANDAASVWINVINDIATGVAQGSYDYLTTFSLNGFIPSTVQLNFVVAADNSLANVLLNGVATGISHVGFAAWSGTNTLQSGFVSGTNTLEFRTINDPATPNPAGFRAVLSGSGLGANPNGPLASGRTTYYFRKTFVYTGDPAYTTLRLNALLADGAVFYLNGVEVYRQNMPGGGISYSTPALADVATPTYSGLVPISASSLVAGTNVIAVEIHQAVGGVEGALLGAELWVTPLSAPPVTLTFNEFSASTNAEFWLELANYGTNGVLLDGCVIYRDGTTNSEYVFPTNNLSLAPGSFLALTNTTLGFLPVSGDKLYLLSPGRGRVFDSVVVKKAPRARFPDGTGVWLHPAAPTPGAPNSFAFRNEIVINEIMYRHALLPSTNNLPPQRSPEQWIELFNRSSNTVDLTGWELGRGINYLFTPGTTLAPGAYLIVADDAAYLRSLYPSLNIAGNFGGRLSGKSDLIVLRDPTGNPADEVRYFDGGAWPGYANGGGSSLELRDPAADNSRAEAWAASDESRKTSWQTYSYRMVANVPSGSGQPTTWNDFIFGLLDGGECLIDDISVVESPTNSPIQFVANGNFESGLTGWRVLGTHGRSRVEVDPDNAANHVLHLIATGPQEHMHNHIEATYTSGRTVVNSREYQISFRARWLAGNNFLNTRLYFNRAPGTTTLPMPPRNGTPGAPNSRWEPNLGPTFSQLQHRAVVPQPGAAVMVSVNAQDPQGVTLCQLWWSANGGTWSNAPMAAQRGAGYTGTIPGYAAGTVVQFYVRAVDGLGAAATFPAAGPSSGALYVVADGQANLPLAHNVRLILTRANTDLMHGTAQGSNQTNVMSNDLLPCTVVYDEQRAYYDCGVHLRGSQRGRYSDNRTGFHIEFQPDDLFRGVHPVMLIDRSGAGDASANKQEEIVLKHILNRAGGIPGTYSEICRLIAPRSAHTGPAQWFPRHEDVFIESAFENGGDGNMFELELIYYPTTANAAGYKLPQPDGVIGTDFTDLGTDKEIYRYNFMIKGHRDADDYRPFVNFARAMSLSGAAFQTQTELILDMDEWLRAYALVSLCSVGDMYTFGNNHNWFIYVRPSDGKILYFPWDMDFAFTRGSSGALVGDQNLGRLINLTPNLRRLYAHMLDIINVSFNSGYMAYWTDHYDNFAPGQSYAGALANIGARATYVRNTINSAGGNAAFSVSSPGVITTSSNVVTLTGTAPVQVRTIRVNGSDFPITWTSLSGWTLRLPVSSPTNTLNIATYDIYGNLLSSNAGTVTVNYTGPAPDPRGFIVINEIMFSPLVPDAEYVEIFNTSSNVAFDLSGWRFNGLDYTFANGALIGPRNFLVLTKNLTAFLQAYGNTMPVFDVFPGNLQADGETITLEQPVSVVTTNGDTVTNYVVIDKVRYEGVLPWNISAIGTGSSLQLIDPFQDNSRPGNWFSQYIPPVYDSGTNFLGVTNAGWIQVVRTGTVQSNANFWIWMQEGGGGDVYLDDIMLVAGTNASVGPNLLQNGDFESPWDGTWAFTTNASGVVTATNLTNTVISTAMAHSGNAALHVISTGAGGTSKAIIQYLPPQTTNFTATLSYWFYATTNGTNLTVRTYPGSLLNTSTNVRPQVFAPYYIPPQLLSRATNYLSPGLANPIATNLPPFPLLWLNEVQPENVTGIQDPAGHRVPWIELYNAGTNLVALDGLFLANNYTNLTQWAFPPGASIGPGEFKVIFADGATNESSLSELHAGFPLSPANGSVTLSRVYQGQPQVLHDVKYRLVRPDRSYGSYPDGQPFARQEFFHVTPGAPNDNTAAPLLVYLNEWMASNTRTLLNTNGNNRYDDWFEIYNPGDAPANLTGYFLTDNLTNRFQFAIPPGFVVPPHGFLLVWADNNPGLNNTNVAELHTSFRLDQAGEQIGLFAGDGTMIDGVTFGQQFTDISQGRYADATDNIYFLAQPTPAGPNTIWANRYPVITPVPDATAFAALPFILPIQASDPDSPPQTLTYSLTNGAPTNATIDPSTGVFSFTPLESQVGATYTNTVEVRDNGSPPLSASRTFHVTVSSGAGNRPPVIDPIAAQATDEGVLFTLPLPAHDPDAPPQTLAFTLLSVLPGASVDAAGVFTWTPAENQGPSTNTIVVAVADNGVPPMSATRSFTLVVREVNTAPVLALLPDAILHAGATLTITNRATDGDLPANLLTYSLTNAPAGATVGANSGVLTWTPPDALAGTTNSVTVRVADNGVPPMSDQKTFRVVVVSRPRLEVAATNGTVVLTWRALPGRTYRVQRTTDLNPSNWQDLGDVLATGDTASKTDPVGAATQRFYRILVLP